MTKSFCLHPKYEAKMQHEFNKNSYKNLGTNYTKCNLKICMH